MTLTDALNAASSANMAYLTDAAMYFSLVNSGSPQPATDNAKATAATSLQTLKDTQAAVDEAYGAL